MEPLTESSSKHQDWGTINMQALFDNVRQFLALEYLCLCLQICKSAVGCQRYVGLMSEAQLSTRLARNVRANVQVSNKALVIAACG